MQSFFCVFLGSGLGGVLRWLLSGWLNGVHPIGTLAVNVFGCFVLGALTKFASGSESTRLLLMTGLCGGFTTFSTFINENVLMLRTGQLLMPIAYMVISLVGGLLACAAAYKLF